MEVFGKQIESYILTEYKNHEIIYFDDFIKKNKYSKEFNMYKFF